MADQEYASFESQDSEVQNGKDKGFKHQKQHVEYDAHAVRDRLAKTKTNDSFPFRIDEVKSRSETEINNEHLSDSRENEHQDGSILTRSKNETNMKTSSQDDFYSMRTPNSVLRKTEQTTRNEMFTNKNMKSDQDKVHESHDPKHEPLLFSNSYSKKSFDPSETEKMEPFSPLKSSNKKKKDSRNDIWTNAILSEVERDSEISSSTIGNTLVNISVSRNHLKLNILLRILMIIVYI